MCNKMKRILYIEANRDGTVGGSYYILLSLIKDLDKTKFEPHILFCQENFLIPEFRKITPFVYVNNFGPSGSEPVNNFESLIKWPYRFFKQIILKQPRLKRIISEIKPDLVHLGNGYSSMHEWMLACYLNGIKVLVHDHGTRFPCSYRTKFFVRFLDAIVSVSESYKNNVVKQRLKIKRIQRIYNGLNIEQFKNKINFADNNKLIREFNLRKDQPIVGIIGNIIRWKGQHVVLQAIKEVKEKHPEIKCLIVGKVALRSESYKQELDSYIIDNDLKENIIFTGFRNNVPDILSLLDIMIHASIEPEPFGMVLLEGMAMGKPIIATNAGGPTEIVVNGETGILIPVNDHAKMAEAMIYFLSNKDEGKKMGEKGRQRLIEMFSIKKMVDEIESLYEDIFTEV